MPYFTTAELRALPDLDDADRFPDGRLQAAHDWIAALIRRECETSFIVETVTDERLSGHCAAGLPVADPYVRAVTALTVDGVAWSEGEVQSLIVEDGFVYQAGDTHWSTSTRRNVTISYTAGYSETPPADLKEAALRGARYWLLTMDGWTGVDERSTSITNDYGNINLAVASADGRPTGLPMVDATITAWARKVRVPKVS